MEPAPDLRTELLIGGGDTGRERTRRADNPATSTTGRRPRLRLGPRAAAPRIPALPQDFKDLLGAYGDVRFYNVLRLYRPSTGPYLDLAEVTLASRDPLASDE